MTFQLVLAVVLLVVVAGVGVAVMVSMRKKREARDTAAFHASRERELHIPVSLHPVIDPDICIGSLACVRACPEGDILGIVEGTARLIEGAKCIGHGRCAEECPVDAIKLVFGSGERGVDLPSLGSGFETSRPGVHVVGELGGMGLIKNAIAQGVQVVDHLAKTVANPGNGAVDVAIVGAGPAGLAAAAACRTQGLSFRLLEQNTLGGAVAHYPRQKLVMTESVEVPGYGRIGKKTLRKEEILETFRDLATTTGVQVEEGVKVERLEGELDRFVLHTTRGTIEARRVVLAVGRRGTPRKLGVPGEELGKVTYGLIDPDQYEGKRVMVIGGGDSAIEAAVLLAEDTGAEVSISYRGPAFGRCRPANREAVERLVDEGRVHAFMHSNVRAIEDDAVLIDVDGRQAWLANEYVIVNIGGELPFAFLENVGVEVKPPPRRGSGLQARGRLRPGGEGQPAPQPHPLRRRRGDHRLPRHRRVELLPHPRRPAAELAPGRGPQAVGVVGPRGGHRGHRVHDAQLPLRRAASACKLHEPREAAQLALLPHVRGVHGAPGHRLPRGVPVQKPPGHGHRGVAGDRGGHRHHRPLPLWPGAHQQGQGGGARHPAQPLGAPPVADHQPHGRLQPHASRRAGSSPGPPPSSPTTSPSPATSSRCPGS